MTDYSPKSLAEVVIGDAFSNDAVNYIADGSLPFPNAGKNGFLIHGPYGTGKTTLAKLLPSEIEQLHGKPANPFYWFREGDEDGKVNGKIVKDLASASTLQPLGTHFNHFIIDEVDLLSTAHQRKLRSSMNVNNGIFYLTTNNIHAIDGGVRNRCFEIHMCAASADQWLPLFNRVLADKGAQIISPLSALPIIEKCGGSIRDIVAAANVTAVKLLKQAAANSNTADQDAA